jgi:hypothetical protein
LQWAAIDPASAEFLSDLTPSHMAVDIKELRMEAQVFH